MGPAVPAPRAMLGLSEVVNIHPKTRGAQLPPGRSGRLAGGQKAVRVLFSPHHIFHSERIHARVPISSSSCESGGPPFRPVCRSQSQAAELSRGPNSSLQSSSLLCGLQPTSCFWPRPPPPGLDFATPEASVPSLKIDLVGCAGRRALKQACPCPPRTPKPGLGEAELCLQ